jgi:hypothetical protein
MEKDRGGEKRRRGAAKKQQQEYLLAVLRSTWAVGESDKEVV